MSEAFKQHLPIWIVLVSALALAVILVNVIDSRQAGDPSENLNNINNSTEPAAELKDLNLVYKVGGLAAPVDIASTQLSGDRRLFIAEQRGMVKIADLATGQIVPKLVLDISSKVIYSGEMGLLGLVFDPDLSKYPFIYVNYVRPSNGGRETVIARYQLNADQTAADPATEKVILTVSQPYENHNAGDLAFGPDGYLYIPLGDGGGAGDPQNRAQNPANVLGKILRVDVHQGEAYSVPPDNPFVNKEGYRPEIWSLGWRNPWRLSFDRDNGDMWVADVGQNKIEEVNHEPYKSAGRNYGWRCFEGTGELNLSGCGDRSNYTFPVAQYSHTDAPCYSVTGGFVYHGQKYPGLNGHYFYADYCTGDIYNLKSTQATYSGGLLKGTTFNISTFGEDSDGELFLADAKTGTIYQITAP